VIGTTPGGHCDMIVDGETGLLVRPGDVRALRRAMEFLLADAPRRERMGRAAKERACRFSADNVIPRFFEAFESVATREGGAPDR
jgi:glycosyltransferase involved in cell wall biosynthesis